MATVMKYGTDRHGVRVIRDDPQASPGALRALRAFDAHTIDPFICPKCSGLDPDCDVCVSETPVANAIYYIRQQVSPVDRVISVLRRAI